MTEEEFRNILPLWDYGWLDYQLIRIPLTDDPLQTIQSYMNSREFSTTFLSPVNQYDADLHGPFKAADVQLDDFELISVDKCFDEIRSIRDNSPILDSPTDDQWQAVENLCQEIVSRNQWIWKLRLTESDNQGSRSHEAGFVHWVFREFVFGTSNLEQVERLVFGYD